MVQDPPEKGLLHIHLKIKIKSKLKITPSIHRACFLQSVGKLTLYLWWTHHDMTTTALHCYLLRKYFTAGQIHQIPQNPTVITVCPTLPPLCGSHHNHFTTCPCHPSCLHPFIYLISPTKSSHYQNSFFSKFIFLTYQK